MAVASGVPFDPDWNRAVTIIRGAAQGSRVAESLPSNLWAGESLPSTLPLGAKGCFIEYNSPRPKSEPNVPKRVLSIPLTKKTMTLSRLFFTQPEFVWAIESDNSISHTNAFLPI
jgi:hypothetical protein